MNKADLITELENHLAEIENLCREYDAGDEDVTTLIAEKIVPIFQSNDQSKSLLAQLKLSHIQLNCSSETYQPKSVNNFIGLLALVHKKQAGWTYVPKLEKSVLVKVSVDNWWHNKKVIVDSNSVAYSRAKIVKGLAGQDQVAIDTSGWNLKDVQGNHKTISPLPATVRQIAYELIQTFQNIDINKESKLHYKPQIK